MINLQPRKNFYSKLASAVKGDQSFPLMHEAVIPPTMFQKLRQSLHFYLAATLIAEGLVPIGSVDDDNFLAKNYDALKRCANITPNGIVLPKLENFLEFNIVHRNVVQIMETTKLFPFLGKIHLPISIRMVNGMPDEKLHSRPFASTKLHTEIWSGHPNHGVISVPICGNIEGTAPEFFEPIDPNESFLTTVDNYDVAKGFYQRLEQYNIRIRPAHYYLYDVFVVHRTVKRGGGPRISIDFPVMYSETIDNLKLPKDRQENYIDANEWMAVGSTQVMFTAETFQDIEIRLAQEKAHGKLSYAAKFERINLQQRPEQLDTAE